LAVYFSQCFKSSDADKCPTEEICSRTNLPLSKPGATPEIECPKCERRFSKDGWLEPVESERLDPRTVQRIAARAFELDALQNGGAVFAYPTCLEPWEWLALRLLVVERSKYESEQMKQKTPPKTYGEAEFKQESIEHIKRVRAGRS
jgi:hypothetical protein